MDTPHYVDIEQKDFITTHQVNKVAIFVVNVELFTKAEIHVHFINQDGDVFRVHKLFMEGQDYQDWMANDDNYVINWALGQMEVTRLSQNN